MLFGTGRTFLLRDDTIPVVDILLTHHIETTIIQPAQHLGPRENFSHFPSTEIIETTCQPYLWTHSMPKKIKKIDDIGNHPWVFAEDLGTTFLCSIESTDKITVLLQFCIGTTQKPIQVPDCIQMFLCQEDFRFTVRHCPSLISIII